MSKRDYLPKTQDAYLKWHDNLKANVNRPLLVAGKPEISLTSDVAVATAKP